MKRKMVGLIGIVVLVGFLLAGCGENRRLKEARMLADGYLSELRIQISEDTLSFKEINAEQFGNMLAFTIYSEKYGDDFKICVNSDDKITDSYFAVSLRDVTRNEFSALMDKVLPDVHPDFELTLKKNTASSALSGRIFRSIHEAHDAAGRMMGLVQVYLSSGSSQIQEEGLAKLLKAMKVEGFYGDLSIADDVRVFHISEKEINYTRTDNPPGKVVIYDYPPLGGE